MIVLKFGGTSVSDAEAIERAGGIIAKRMAKGPIVVVSALAGVTNALVGIAEQAAKGHLIGAIRAIESLRERHLEQAELLLGSGTDAGRRGRAQRDDRRAGASRRGARNAG